MEDHPAIASAWQITDFAFRCSAVSGAVLHSPRALCAKYRVPIGKLQHILNGMGYALDDVALRMMFNDVAEFEWPRSVSWKALPIITDPRYEASYSGAYLLSDDIGLDFRKSKAELSSRSARRRLTGESTRVLIIATKRVGLKDLYELEALFRQEHPSSERMIMHFDGAVLRDIPASEIAAARDMHYPHDRFVYNHVVNLLVIGGRANLSAARDRGESQWHVEQFAPRLHGFHWRFGHPLLIQMLYEVGRTGEGVPTSWFRDKSQENEWLWGNRSAFFSREGDADVFRWRGSGNYREWSEIISPPISEFAEPGAKMQRSYGKAMVTWMSALNFGDYVCLDENGVVCLSSKGRKYLDLVGKALADPDVLLRWRTPDGRFCEMKDVPAVDRWLNRAFRKMKRAVAHLPASQIDEDYEEQSGPKWPQVQDHLLAIRGWRMDVTDEMLLDHRFASEVAKIEGLHASLKMADLTMGVVRAESGFGDQGGVTALWFGVPLAVFADRYADVGKYELLTDWSRIDEEVRSMPVPEWFVKKADPIGTQVFTERQAAAEVFVRPERVMEETGKTWPVIHGRVLRLSGPIQEEDLAEAISMQEMGQGFMVRNPDGIKVFGKGRHCEHKAVSIGIQVGAYDPETNAIAMATSSAEYRSENIEWLFYRNEPRGSGLAGLVVQHPDFSDEGYRIIRPDGVAIDVEVIAT